MIGLNPCFNGRYSQSFAAFKKLVKENVLILVLMEDTLRDMGESEKACLKAAS